MMLIMNPLNPFMVVKPPYCLATQVILMSAFVGGMKCKPHTRIGSGDDGAGGDGGDALSAGH